MIAIFAALALEVERFARRLAALERLSAEGFLLSLGEYDQQPLLICRTGIGRRAGQAAAAVLARYRVDAALSIGLAGALSPQWRVGELVLCERVRLSEPGNASEGVIRCSERLLGLAQRVVQERGLRGRIGASFTTGHVVSDPQEKRALWGATSLDVVEMESYWVGRAALEARVPFLAIRVISDGAADPLPDIPGVVTPEGEMRPCRAIPYALRRPAQVPLLLRTAASEYRAVGCLTRFLEGFVVAFQGERRPGTV